MKHNKPHTLITAATLLFGVVLVYAGFVFLRTSRPQYLFRIVDQDKVGYMDVQGKVVIQPMFPAGDEFSEGLAAVRVGGLYGFIDTDGDFVIRPQYEFARRFEHGLACVYRNGKAYFINRQNEVVVDTAYVSAQRAGPGVAAVSTLSKKMGLLRLQTGILLADTIWTSIGDFIGGVAVVRREYGRDSTQYAVIDVFGKLVVPPGRYRYIDDFSDGLARARQPENDTQSRDILINSQGKELSVLEMSRRICLLGNYHEGLAIVLLQKRWLPADSLVYGYETDYRAYVDTTGRLVFNDSVTTDLEDFCDGRAFRSDSKRRDQYTLIDRQFKQVCNEVFDRVQETFRNHYAVVEQDGHWGIIDTNGRFVVKPTYRDIHDVGLRDSFFFFSEQRQDAYRYGIGTISGRLLLPPILNDFDRAGFRHGLLKVTIDGCLAYVDRQGKIIWKERKGSGKKTRPLNIDFMNRSGFYASGFPDREALERYARRGLLPDTSGYPKKLDKAAKDFPPDVLSLTVYPNRKDTVAGGYPGLKVKLVNATAVAIDFDAVGGGLDMVVQARRADGHWDDIEYVPSSFCGNSYFGVKLDSNHFWDFVTPIYKGARPCKMRIKLHYPETACKAKPGDRDPAMLTVYSNEYNGSINPGQFWNKLEYHPGGLMDPYLD